MLPPCLQNNKFTLYFTKVIIEKENWPGKKCSKKKKERKRKEKVIADNTRSINSVEHKWS